MCLILVAFREHPEYELILLANRDEFLDRPTLPADFWGNRPGVLGGRDLKSGGSWMLVDTRRRMAAVTNVREPGLERPDAVSRGHLVTTFMKRNESSLEFAQGIRSGEDSYNGFNLLLWDGKELVFTSNRTGRPPEYVPPGIHGISNADLNTPWPKVVTGKAALATLLESATPLDVGACLDILEDERTAPDHELPDTGVPLEWERTLSARCIRSATYGTRSSTVITVATSGEMRFLEKTHVPNPKSVTFELRP